MTTLIRLLELLLVPGSAIVLLTPLQGSRICVALLVSGVALLAGLTVVSTVIAV